MKVIIYYKELSKKCIVINAKINGIVYAVENGNPINVDKYTTKKYNIQTEVLKINKNIYFLYTNNNIPITIDKAVMGLVEFKNNIPTTCIINENKYLLKHGTI